MLSKESLTVRPTYSSSIRLNSLLYRAIIDEFFKNQYSTNQRLAMLNALALGARELASLPVPESKVDAGRTAFPSRMLPPNLHRKYVADSSMYEDSRTDRLLEDITRRAIESGKDAAEREIPEVSRTRQLRLRQPTGVSEINNTGKTDSAATRPLVTSFASIAAEYFLGPFIAAFWAFLRDERTRESRTAHHSRTYTGTGTGLILSPMVLSQFLRTISVMLHAARHSPAYLAVLAPEALEVAITLGTRPMSNATEDKERDATVLNSSLELALVALDGCLDLDGGRSIALEHSTILLGTGEWAGQIFSLLEEGVRVQGGGGIQEVKLKRVAAGLVLKVEEIVAKYRQSMISL